MNSEVKQLMDYVIARNPNEPEFVQAVQEVAETVIPFINKNDKYKGKQLLERMIEPERIFMFRVPWVDDQGNIQINRGFRVQMNSAIGPYKGGLRFHPSVNVSVLKFLAFEQTFKNSLTTLALGGGKGGSDFDPKGKSDNEVMRFCQSFMTELSKYIGADTDIPAGDIGVGAREIGFLYGQYKRLRDEFTGVLTGKGLSYGGSLMRPEATGYGTVYFALNMLETKGKDLQGKKVVISGSGNVAQFACEKAMELGATVVAFSDSSGYVHDPKGITKEKLDFIQDLKNVKRGRIKAYADAFEGVTFVANERPWSIPCDIALPCATQNELDKQDAQTLVDNGCICVSEGANMPSTADAIQIFKDNQILFAPGKASNAGGVATSGLEMSQNSIRIGWDSMEVDIKLKEIMQNIHQQCVKHGTEENGFVDYVKGANIAGFVKVADAMLEQGVV